jgi:hypothetical protein
MIGKAVGSNDPELNFYQKIQTGRTKHAFKKIKNKKAVRPKKVLKTQRLVRKAKQPYTSKPVICEKHDSSLKVAVHFLQCFIFSRTDCGLL